MELKAKRQLERFVDTTTEYFLKENGIKSISYPPKDVIKIIDGVKYRVVRHRCVCSCHTTGAVHFVACCNDGFIESLEKVLV